MPKFINLKKKPIVVEAIRWTGSNLEEIRNFVGNDLIENYIEHFDIERALIKQTLAGIAMNIHVKMVLKNVGKSGLYKTENNTLKVRFYVNRGHGNFF